MRVGLLNYFKRGKKDKFHIKFHSMGSFKLNYSLLKVSNNKLRAFKNILIYIIYPSIMTLLTKKWLKKNDNA